MTSRHAGYIVLTFKFRKEQDGIWTAECIELGTATFSRTLERVQAEIEDLVTLHLNTLEDLEERDAFFERHGIEFHRSKPKKATCTVPADKTSFIQCFPQRIPTHQYA
ncbi:MAG: hypothetical protein P9M14_01210 [Candidatus Alcyoniella australis]|nr:hypothetical protein [Candidatus Alcyoniella australis]